MEKIEKATNSLSEELQKHMEEFAAAFLKQTGLSPDEVVMCHTMRFENNHLVNRIWFEKKRTESILCETSQAEKKQST